MPTPSSLDNIFPFIGQSEMSGRAPPEGAPAHGDLSNAWLLKQDGTWQNPPTDPANDPTSAQYSAIQDTGALVGPINYVADRWLRFQPHQQIGLVPCAKGGLKMSAFARSTNTSTVYGAAKARWEAAAVYGPIAGVFIWQGVGNCDNTTDRDAWLAGFTQLVADLRSDIGNANLPIVAAIIGPFSAARQITSPYGDDMRVIQKRVNIPGVVFVHNANATLYDDVHPDAVSSQSWGFRAADAMRLLGA